MLIEKNREVGFEPGDMSGQHRGDLLHVAARIRRDEMPIRGYGANRISQGRGSAAHKLSQPRIAGVQIGHRRHGGIPVDGNQQEDECSELSGNHQGYAQRQKLRSQTAQKRNSSDGDNGPDTGILAVEPRGLWEMRHGLRKLIGYQSDPLFRAESGPVGQAQLVEGSKASVTGYRCPIDSVNPMLLATLVGFLQISVPIIHFAAHARLWRNLPPCSSRFPCISGWCSINHALFC